ncbi:hypothetical protein AAHE18_16G258300 [Arachis hypogaea]
MADDDDSPSIGDTICKVLMPFMAVVEVFMIAVANCFNYQSRCIGKNQKPYYNYEDLARLAQGTRLEALYVLFKRLSSSIIDDGLIHKEELQLALFQTPNGENFFLDRVFDLFDEKSKGVIDFDEFVHTLNAFKLYDIRKTGFIEREELKQMVKAMLMESDMNLSDDLLEAIVDKTIADADKDKDGKISKEDWKVFVSRNPSILKNMTLAYLKDIACIFPSFIFKSDAEI